MESVKSRKPLRGRAGELSRAQRALDRTAKTGQSGAILVSGEPGIGKTAFVNEIVERSRVAGFCAGISKAEEVDQIAPMAPLLVALRSQPTPLLSRNDFVELASLYGQQLWLIDRLTSMLEERALQSPLLIAIDDVQWADRLSVFALRVLPSRLAGCAIIWVFATRSHPMNVAHEIVNSVSRDVPVETIALGPLQATAIDELARDRMGKEPSVRLRELLNRSDGFPFLAVELAEGYAHDLDPRQSEASLAPFGTSNVDKSELPEMLILSVRSRLQSLPEATLRLVQVACVLGRSFALEDAAALLNVTPWTNVLPTLESAVHAGVLADHGERVTFRHDLFREAAYEDVPPSLRVALHRAAANNALAVGREPLDAAPHALAYADRGDAQAIEILRKAAAAVSPIMPSVAVTLIERAFTLLKSDDPLWLEIGREAINIFAEARRGRDAVSVADQLLQTPLEHELAAHIQTQVTRLLWGMGYVEEMRSRADSALALDHLSEQSRAELLALRALSLSHTGNFSDALAAGERALEESRRVVGRAAEQDALKALGEASRNDGRHSTALEYFAQLHALDTTASRVDEIMSLQLLDRYDLSGQMLSDARTNNGDRRDIMEAPELAFAQMWHDLGLGLLDEAEADALTLRRLCEDLQEPSFQYEAYLILNRVAQLRGKLPTARAHLDSAAARANSDDESQALLLSFMSAWQAHYEGDAQIALAIVRRVVFPARGARHRWRWQPAWLIAATQIAMVGKDLNLAKDIASQARLLADRNPKVATVLGIAAHAEGLASGETDTLRRAVALLRASPRCLVRASAFVDLGIAELAHGDRDSGIAALDDAWGIFNRQGADGEARRVQHLLQGAGVRRRRWATAIARPLEGWAALTTTERSVARLVADGHTNRSAAATLLLSPNTVATHLRSIFGKLDVQSRVQLTRAVIIQP